MTLLDPASAITAGAIAGPLLVMLYFLKLRRLRLHVGSTLLWQRAVKDLQVNEPFRWLRPSSLLFLQLLAVAMMATALGRPAIPGGAAASDRVLLVIDRSASMNALDGPAGRSRFEEAIATARGIIGDLGTGASVQIIAFAAGPEIRLAFSTDHAAALRALERITPTDQPDNIKQALELAQSLLRAPVTEQASPDQAAVVLISDGGFDQSKLALAGGDIEFHRVGPPESRAYDNLGITHFNITTDFDDPAITRLFMRIENASDREISTTVSLTSSTGPVNRQPVRVPAASETGPGTQTLTFELDRGQSGLVTAAIDRRDLLQADNAARAIIAPAAPPRVMLVTPDDDDGSLDWVLRNTLEEMSLARLQTVSVTEFTAQATSQTTGQINDTDLLVFDRVDVPPGIPAPTISFAGALPDVPIQTTQDGPDRFTAWSRLSPIMRRLVLDDIHMRRPAWFDTTAIGQSIDELASGRLGPNIVLFTESGHPRLGVAFEPAQSNWPLDIAFPLFLIQAVESLTFEANASSGIFATTRSAASIELAGGTGGLLELNGPARIRVQAPPTASDKPRRVPIGIPERAGIYNNTAGAPVLAINLMSSHESSLATSDTVRIAGRSIQAGTSDQGFREIWHWFVIAAAGVLTLEWLLFAAKMRT